MPIESSRHFERKILPTHSCPIANFSPQNLIFCFVRSAYILLCASQSFSRAIRSSLERPKQGLISRRKQKKICDQVFSIYPDQTTRLMQMLIRPLRAYASFCGCPGYSLVHHLACHRPSLSGAVPPNKRRAIHFSLSIQLNVSRKSQRGRCPNTPSSLLRSPHNVLTSFARTKAGLTLTEKSCPEICWIKAITSRRE